MRVVLVVEDSLPNRHVGAATTPTLWSLIAEGGWHAAGGESVLASSTYPNHASFVTGTDVGAHRIVTNTILHDGSFVCSSTVGPEGDTLFDAARRAGRSSSAILGDHTMVGVMAATRADVHWPPDGAIPADVPTDCLGYPSNAAVLDQVDRLDAIETDLVIIHMNDPDSTMHRFGPRSDETIARIRDVDDDLASIVERLRPTWDDTVLLVLSDHEQETIDHELEPVDLARELASAGLRGVSFNEGMVGVVYDGPGAAELGRLDPIEGAVDVAPDVSVAWSAPGRRFGTDVSPLAGGHGSPRTMTQVSVVSGGHPRVYQLADALSRRRPHATDWAPTIAALLGVGLPVATGRSLLT